MQKDISDILLRYGIAVIAITLSLLFPIFYFIFRPLTIMPVTWFLNLFYETNFTSLESLVIEGKEILFVDACIGGSAYVLLLLLNLLTREINLKKRIFLFLFGAFSLLILNIVRLIILVFLFLKDHLLFDLTHKLFWYALSTIFVATIWLFSVKLFKIKATPFISDLKFLFKKIKIKT